MSCFEGVSVHTEEDATWLQLRWKMEGTTTQHAPVGCGSGAASLCLHLETSDAPVHL